MYRICPRKNLEHFSALSFDYRLDYVFAEIDLSIYKRTKLRGRAFGDALTPDLPLFFDPFANFAGHSNRLFEEHQATSTFRMIAEATETGYHHSLIESGPRMLPPIGFGAVSPYEEYAVLKKSDVVQV
jgi:hypothetical protein